MSTQSLNPRTGEVFGPLLPDSDDQQVRAACAEAARAAAPWAALPPARRAEVLDSLAAALDEAADLLVPLADSETGLGEPRLSGELARTSFQLRMLATAVRDGTYAESMVDEAVPGAPPAGHPELRRVLVPIGPVAVYGASNFPFAFSVAGGDTASALAAGCTVVVKAHPGHPQTSEEVYGVLRRALAAEGVPEGVLGIVRGFSAGTTLIQDPAIRAGAFTGSRNGGRALFDLANARPAPIPFYGELGSVNPVVVLSSAVSRPGLAGDYVDSLLLGGGQFCTNPSVLFVPAGAGLEEQIATELAGRGPALLLHPGVVSELDRSVGRVMSAEGVSVLAGDGSTAGPDGSLHRTPLLLATTVASLTGDRTPLEVECFGPVGLLARYETLEELLGLLSSMDGALAGCVHGEPDDSAAAAVISALTGFVGRVAWNAWPTGVAVTPHQHHGGPWPATTNALHTSVGVTAIRRFLRPVVYQSVPGELLPRGGDA